MKESGDVLCFHCGMPIGDPPQLNELAEGEACPVCRDRLLEELPPILHSPQGFERLRAGEDRGNVGDADDDLGATGFSPRLVEDDPGQADSGSRD